MLILLELLADSSIPKEATFDDTNTTGVAEFISSVRIRSKEAKKKFSNVMQQLRLAVTGSQVSLVMELAKC